MFFLPTLSWKTEKTSSTNSHLLSHPTLLKAKVKRQMWNKKEQPFRRLFKERKLNSISKGQLR
jgi:hypothetical protein